MKNFHETLLPKKEVFYSDLNMKDIKDAGYNHPKRFCKNTEIKKLGEYQKAIHYYCLIFLKTLEKCVQKFMK